MLGYVRVGLWALIGVIGVFAIGRYMLDHSLDDAPSASVVFGAPFQLVDQNGAAITHDAFAGRPVALFFGFTHCPNICPTTLFELSAWLSELGEEGERIGAFFVTLDPARDTPEVMKSYVSAFSRRIVGITGEATRIAALAKAWRVFVRKVPLEGNDYTIDHTASVFLVRPDGTLQGTIGYGEGTAVAIRKLKNLARQPL